MKTTPLASLLAGTLALTACGGGGGGNSQPSVTSFAPAVPQPQLQSTEVVSRTALTANPAITTGTYQTIGLVNGPDGKPLAAPVTLAVDTATKTYTLTVSGGNPPLASAVISYANEQNYGFKTEYLQKYSDGSTNRYTETGNSGYFSATIPTSDTRRVNVNLQTWPAGDLDGKNRHTSLGVWAMSVETLTNGVWQGNSESQSGFFVYGDRTSQADMPRSGTATYVVSADTLNNYCEYLCFDYSTLKLTADFAAQSMSAQYKTSNSGSYSEGPNTSVIAYTKTWVATASGTAPILASGDFDIPLSGTYTTQISRVDKTPVPDVTAPATGRITGALFGPQATELGGVATLPIHPELVGGDGTITTAFTAVKQAP